MKLHPSHLLVLAITAASSISTTAFSATEATTDPVGFTTLTINGTGGTKPSETTFLGLGLARAVDYQATAETVSGATLTCSSATWTDNQFASTPPPGYFLEITSGVKTGLMSAVLSSSSTNKTITVADDLSALGVEGSGVSFKIRKNWSLSVLFGATNTAGFTSGSATSADIISIYNPNVGTGGYDQFYYSSGGLAQVGWRKIGSNPISQPQGDAPISIDEGLIIKRVAPSDLAITFPGAVKLGQTITSVFPGANFVSNVYPSGILTLGKTDLTANPPQYSSNLYTGLTTSGVKEGSATSADQILIYNPLLGNGAGGYETYYYSSGGLAGTGWRLLGSNPISANQSGTVLQSGRAIFLKRVENTAFNWVIPQPFPNP